MYSFAFTGLKPAACRAQERALAHTVDRARVTWRAHVCTRVAWTRRIYTGETQRREYVQPFPSSIFALVLPLWREGGRERDHPCLSPPLPSGWKNNYPVSWTVSARGPRLPCLRLVPATPPDFQPLPTLLSGGRGTNFRWSRSDSLNSWPIVSSNRCLVGKTLGVGGLSWIYERKEGGASSKSLVNFNYFTMISFFDRSSRKRIRSDFWLKKIIEAVC